MAERTAPTEDALAVADALRVATNRAADLLERLDVQNTARSAKLGVLPDGTPVEDMLTNLRELQTENTELRKIIRDVKFQANRKASERSDAIAKIREIVANGH